MPDPPVVDHVRDDREPPRADVGPGGGRLVLVTDPLGPGQARLVPEGAAEQLVPREHVTEDLRVLLDEVRRPRVVQPAHPGQLRESYAVPAGDRAGDEVGAGPALLVQQHLVGVRRDDVVGVGEGQQLAARVPDPLVAGGPQPVVVGVHDADPGVAAGVLVRDRARAVGGAVVDDHDLEVPVALRQDAVERLGQVGRDVVHRHDHADQRRPPPELHGLTVLSVRLPFRE